MNDKLTKARYSEWQASLWGACSIAFGLGLLLASSDEIASFAYFKQFAIGLILMGIILHGWGMYKIYRRNEKK